MARRKRPKSTPGTFTVSGVPLESLYPRRLCVTWKGGNLSGDPALTAAAIERASAMRQSLSDPASALSLLAALFIPGTVETGGDLPA